jgi:hypothetical protein
MKTNFYPICVLMLLLIGMQEMSAQTMSVFQNFDVDPEWDGSGNTGNTLPNSTDYGYRNIEGVTGVTEGDYGCIGGIFNRWEIVSYYADTDLNGDLDRTMTLKVAGSMKLENRETGSFDGAFYLGYFDATNPTVKNFFGIMIKEPANKGLFPFRGVVTVNEASNTPEIELVQLEKLDFDLTYTGTADGSGVMTGKLAGTDIYVIVPAGTGTFNSFGLMNGGIGDQTRNERTRNCYFDDLTYTKIDDGSVDTYTVSYDANGGTGTITSDTKTHDVSLTLSDGSGFTREGYNFSSWNSSADGSGTAYAAGAAYNENADITLYAIWSEATSVDQKSIDMISIYPNPTADRLNIQNIPEDSRIVLLDLTGRIIIEKKASELNGGLSLQPYANGLYMVKVMQGQEHVTAVRVLKQ